MTTDKHEKKTDKFTHGGQFQRRAMCVVSMFDDLIMIREKGNMSKENCPRRCLMTIVFSSFTWINLLGSFPSMSF